MAETKKENKKIEWTHYLACAYAEQFCEGENATAREQIEAFSYIAKTGMWKTLQGWYGRAIRNLVEQGIMDWEGKIDEDVLSNLLEE